MATLSVYVQGRTATFPQCVSTCPAVWGRIFMRGFQCVCVCPSFPCICACRCISLSSRFVSYLVFSPVDEVTERRCVFQSIPTSGQLPAGFSQPWKDQLAPCGLNNYTSHKDEEERGISGSEKYGENKGLTIVWTLVCVCVDIITHL